MRAGFLISALYNLAGVGIAAAGLLAPIVCAILMPISSVTVVVFVCGTTAWLGARTFRYGEPRANPATALTGAVTATLEAA